MEEDAAAAAAAAAEAHVKSGGEQASHLYGTPTESNLYAVPHHA